MTGPIVAARGLSRRFDLSPPWWERALRGTPRRILTAVNDVSFEIGKGKTLGLVGESGCGKSTVARCVTNLMSPSSGEIDFCFDGSHHELSTGLGLESRRRIQMIFQDPYSSLNPRWSIGRIIAEPLQAFGLTSGREESRREVARLLQIVGLHPEDARKYPHEFSGGQRQRVSIARALACRSEFLVLDEPTSALDVSVQAQVLNVLLELQRQFQLTYLFISHDLSVIYQMADEVGVMYLGRLVEIGPTEEVFRRPRHPYTRMLLEALPRTDVIGREVAPMAGEVPNPIDPPSGCSFHPRCPLAVEACRIAVPQLEPSGPTRVACHVVNQRQDEAALPSRIRA